MKPIDEYIEEAEHRAYEWYLERISRKREVGNEASSPDRYAKIAFEAFAPTAEYEDSMGRGCYNRITWDAWDGWIEWWIDNAGGLNFCDCDTIRKMADAVARQARLDTIRNLIEEVRRDDLNGDPILITLPDKKVSASFAVKAWLEGIERREMEAKP